MINKASNWVEYCMSQIPCKKGAIALDLACGHGRNSILLAKYNCKVISIDIDILSLKSFNRKKYHQSADRYRKFSELALK